MYLAAIVKADAFLNIANGVLTETRCEGIDNMNIFNISKAFKFHIHWCPLDIRIMVLCWKVAE